LNLAVKVKITMFRVYRACGVVHAEAHAPAPNLGVGSRCAGKS
jgi:hypothetical protein